MWRYFIEKKCFTVMKVDASFINPAFSKFYLKLIMNHRVKLVVVDRMANCSFVYENNEVSLQQLVDSNAKEIFENQNINLKKCQIKINRKLNSLELDENRVPKIIMVRKRRRCRFRRGKSNYVVCVG
jgi:hypothetical protein